MQRSKLLRCLLTLALALIGANVALAADLTTEEKAKRRAALQVPIKCVAIFDSQWTSWLGDHDERAINLPNAKTIRESMSDRLFKQCASPNAKEAVLTLVGGGSIVLYAEKDKYDEAARIAHEEGAVPRLYLNGFDQGTAAALVSELPVAPDNKGVAQLRALRFSVVRGSENRTLWTSLYKDRGLGRTTAPLVAGLGWSGIGLTSPAGDWGNRIAITDLSSLWVASLLILGIVVGFFWMLKETDALRDAPTMWFWGVASRLRRRIWLATLRKDKQGKKLTREEASRIVLDGFEAGFRYDPNQVENYESAAQQALRGDELDPAQMTLAIAGLSSRRAGWVPVRATYSLGRTQMGIWFCFAVAASVFLWAVFGQLPELPPSLVGLLALSAATAGAAKAADFGSSPEGRSYFVSRNFWHDIVTGLDNKEQIHRLQAIVVNALLLGVAVFGVMDELAMPSFEGSWLAFLGVSGAALAAGKQLADGATPVRDTIRLNPQTAVIQKDPIPTLQTVPAGKNLD